MLHLIKIDRLYASAIRWEVKSGGGVFFSPFSRDSSYGWGGKTPVCLAAALGEGAIFLAPPPNYRGIQYKYLWYVKNCWGAFFPPLGQNRVSKKLGRSHFAGKKTPQKFGGFFFRPLDFLGGFFSATWLKIPTPLGVFFSAHPVYVV